MVQSLARYGTALVVIKHPINGNQESGRRICGEVRRKLDGHKGAICFFHDATEMANADNLYAEEFRVLDRELSDRNITVICSIPALVPRIMALTVVRMSSKRWRIFKSRDEAVRHLMDMGASHPDTNEPVGCSVTVRGIKSIEAA